MLLRPRPAVWTLLVVIAGALMPCAAPTPARAAPAAAGTPAGAPPHFDVPVPPGPVTFIAYGDTRFTDREQVANATARRALATRIAAEHPVAVFVGGDLVFQGSDMHDYEVFREETQAWQGEGIPVFPALGNHELRGCGADKQPCIENWWRAFPQLHLDPYRWYSVSLGPTLLALVLDGDSPLQPGDPQREWLERMVLGAPATVRFILVVIHYPPVRDPIFPVVRDEREVASFFDGHARTLRPRIVVVGSHIHNYERYDRDGVTYLVSGGGGAKPVPAIRIFGELSKVKTSVNFHFLRLTLDGPRLSGTMVRFEAEPDAADPWSEPDRFEIAARP